MTIAFIPREQRPGETRIAAVPETVKRLIKAGLTVEIERGAGGRAWISDGSFEAAGARLVGGESWGRADLVLKVQPPMPEEVEHLRDGAILVSFLQPAPQLSLVAQLRERGVTVFSMDLVPRITRAQPMDALSSQATIAGYKAVLIAAAHLGRLCPLMMTAAGTIRPAKAVIFGAGVAGLQAIATAKRLGCAVEATDVRLAAKEQVESLGARFITIPGSEDLEADTGYAKEASQDFLRRQREEVGRRVAEADIVIATAQVPGKPAPRLISEDMVRSMKPGSVIVDLAVENGGNCALSERGKIVEKHGVTLVGLENLPATVPTHASELYAKNVSSLVQLLFDKDGKLAPNLKDEVLAGCRLTHKKEICHIPTAELLAAFEVGSRSPRSAVISEEA